MPLRFTVCCVPGTLPLLSWKLKVPVIGPVLIGAKLMYSSQLAPGASGETPRQAGVPPWNSNPGSIPSTVMDIGSLPLLVRVIFWEEPVVPTA
jgi:hypothetical protein